MKRIIFLLLCSIAAVIIHAQTTKGTVMLGLHNYTPSGLNYSDLPFYIPQSTGLGISFGTAKNKFDGDVMDGKTSITSFGLSVNGHYFVADQFSIGLIGSYFYGSDTYKYPGEEDNKYSATIVGAGPELRYFIPVKESLKAWVKGNAQFGSLTTKENGEVTDDLSLSSFGGGIGLSVFPVPEVSIDLGIGYQVFSLKFQNGFLEDLVNTTNSFVIDIGFGVFLAQKTAK